jgi:solute carrier family 45 protein 1/2/4
MTPALISISERTASPYLLSLGLTKSWMAIVFLGGPLSGLIVQPLIGQSLTHVALTLQTEL